MTWPNANLGPFEGENEAWREHVSKEFSRLVTSPMLEVRECSPAQAAIAHFRGFISCAFTDAIERGDGEQQIMPDVLEKIRPWVEGLRNAEAMVMFLDRKPTQLTVLPGGKDDDSEPGGAA
ncbi:hypothetical protein [Mesorhizobium sp. ISC11]|uniref:hypothetical protein n=1 Tax=Mesorhizobium sp. ISC11 TaxID=3076428 RepID=UPI00301CC498